MKNVSDKYKELSKIEINNIEHKYKFINQDTGIDLTDLVQNETLTISNFLRTAQGNITPNSLNLTLSKPIDEENIKQQENKKVLIKDYKHKYNEYPGIKWKDLIPQNTIKNLISLGDKIVVIDTFNNEEIKIFNGIVKNITERTNRTNEELLIQIEDNSIKGYDKVVSEDVYYENYYIYNSQDKEHSILYKLATQYLEFKDHELGIQDIKIGDEYIKIPVFLIKKGTRVIEKIADLVRSIYGNIYVKSENILVINSYFNKSYIKKQNITIGDKKDNYPVLDFIEKTIINPNNNKVEVKYNESYIDERKPVLKLGGQHATKDDAKLIIRKNTKSNEYWKLDFTGIVNLEKTPIVKVYKYNGDKKEYITYDEYELTIENNQGKVKFNNSKDFDIFIEDFSFYGQQILEYKDNSITYTERKLDNLAENLKSVSFEYIVNQKQATELAKHTYYNECRSYKKLKLKTNNLPFLELEDVINIDFKDITGKYSIIAITQTNTTTELVLKEYREYEANSYNFINVKSNKLSEDKELIKRVEKEVQDKLSGKELDALVGKVTEKFKDEIIETVSQKTQEKFEKIYAEEVKKAVTKVVDSKLNKNWKKANWSKINDIFSEFLDKEIIDELKAEMGEEKYNREMAALSKYALLYSVEYGKSEFVKLNISPYQNVQNIFLGQTILFDDKHLNSVFKFVKNETYSIEELFKSGIDYSYVNFNELYNHFKANKDKKIHENLFDILKQHFKDLPIKFYLSSRPDITPIIQRLYDLGKENNNGENNLNNFINSLGTLFKGGVELIGLVMNLGVIPFFYKKKLYFLTIGDTVDDIFLDNPII